LTCFDLTQHLLVNQEIPQSTHCMPIVEAEY
jgi:hypothetical protein